LISKNLLPWNFLANWTETWWEAPMEGSVLSFLKAEWKVFVYPKFVNKFKYCHPIHCVPIIDSGTVLKMLFKNFYHANEILPSKKCIQMGKNVLFFCNAIKILNNKIQSSYLTPNYFLQKVLLN
jgi:hypothetical protein